MLKYLLTIVALGFVAVPALLGERVIGPPPITPFNPNKPTALPITATPEGFPQQPIVLRPGYYFVMVLNRSGIHGLQLALERMPGSSIVGAAASQIANRAVDARQKRLAELVQLTIGTYRIRALHNPKWVCTLVVK